jgi:hypothetical protein
MTTGNLHDWRSGDVTRRVAALVLGGLLGGFLTGTAHAGAGWRCTAGAATAYRQDPATGHWKTLVIPLPDQRFLVRPAAGPGRWALVREGSNTPPLACAGDFDPAGFLPCGTGDQFGMNRDTLTFTSHLFDVGKGDMEQLTAATVTGTCVAL